MEPGSRRRPSFIPELEQLEIRWLPAPTVGLTAPANSNNGGFLVTVSASNDFNMPSPPVARLDVDVNNNGSFNDSGEQNYTTANMTSIGQNSYSATFLASPSLSNGTYPLRGDRYRQQ